MATAYCPRCRAIRNMRESVTRRTEPDAEGDSRQIETRSHHCETCNSFVWSEDTEIKSERAAKERSA